MSKEINIEDYQTQVRQPIDWSEMDFFGHVNNVMFMKYIQTSRMHFCERIGLMDNYQERGTGFILASTSCQFFRPLTYPGDIILRANYDFMRTSSFGLDHFILNGNKELVALGKDVLVVYDYKKNEKVKIPGWLRNNISALKD